MIGIRPRLTLPDGSPLPTPLHALERAVLDAPAPIRAVARRVTARFLTRRLPPLLARYPDGRSFLIPGADAMYLWAFLQGEWEPVESAVVRHVVRPGDVCVDVGANHGWFTLIMARAASPGGQVVAIEPLPPVLQALRANLARNPGLPVRIVPLAVGAEEGEVNLNVFDDLPPGHASVSTLGRDDHHGVPVRRTTLDAVLAGSPPPALVKVDVEGGELDVLRGAAALLASPDPPIWLLEVNYETSAAFGYRPVQLLDTIAARGEATVLRAAEGRVEPERDAERAGHGDTWVVIPPGRRDRLEGLALLR